MPVKDLTPMSQIDAYTDEQLSRLRVALLRQLAVIGEKCVNKARTTKSYTDRTNNLRSSIGYVIVEDGHIIQAGKFTQTGEGKEGTGSEGQKTGEAYASGLASRFPSGVTLLVVAGMNYASYVSAKGYDVIDGAELLADQLADKMLKDLGLK